MNSPVLSLFTVIFSLAASAAVPLRWTVETSRVTPATFDAIHGETLALEAAFQSYGKPLEMPSDGCCILWQTNGMGSAWWQSPATVASNRVSATFAPAMDPGAPAVTGFLGATGENYRAAFTLRFRHGPGGNPSALPLPTPAIDFATVAVLNPSNAPFAMKGASLGITSNEADRIARAATSNVVDKAYVEGLGFEAGITAQSATNIVDGILAASNYVTQTTLAAATNAVEYLYGTNGNERVNAYGELQRVGMGGNYFENSGGKRYSYEGFDGARYTWTNTPTERIIYRKSDGWKLYNKGSETGVMYGRDDAPGLDPTQVGVSLSTAFFYGVAGSSDVSVYGFHPTTDRHWPTPYDRFARASELAPAGVDAQTVTGIVESASVTNKGAVAAATTMLAEKRGCLDMNVYQQVWGDYHVNTNQSYAVRGEVKGYNGNGRWNGKIYTRWGEYEDVSTTGGVYATYLDFGYFTARAVSFGLSSDMLATVSQVDAKLSVTGGVVSGDIVMTDATILFDKDYDSRISTGGDCLWLFNHDPNSQGKGKFKFQGGYYRSHLVPDESAVVTEKMMSKAIEKMNYHPWTNTVAYAVGNGVTREVVDGATTNVNVYICLAPTGPGEWQADHWSNLGTQPLQTIAADTTALKTSKQGALYTEATVPIVMAGAGGGGGPRLTTSGAATVTNAVSSRVLTAVTASATDADLATARAMWTLFAALSNRIDQLEAAVNAANADLEDALGGND